MKNKQKLRLYNYTLVELLAAMVVFTLIMLALMGFFSTAQKIWTQSNNKVIMFEDARVAMNLMTRDLQSSFYNVDYSGPFLAKDNGTQITRLDFVAKLSEKPSYQTYGTATSTYAEVRYWWDSSTYCLKRCVIGDNMGTANWNFYDCNGTNQETTIFTTTPAEGTAEVIPRVVDFKAVLYIQNSTLDIVQQATTTTEYPYAVLLQLTLLDKVSFAKWKNVDGSSTSHDIVKNNSRTFTKLILLGDRGQYAQ
jgi:type II secretory pathway pseudopilin PulG